MKQNIKAVLNWQWILFVFILKILGFYYLVDAVGVQYLVGILTFGFFFVLFDYFRRKNGKWAIRVFMGIYVFITVVMVLDIFYYKYFIQYISVNQFFQISSLLATTGELDMGPILSASAALFLFIDIPLVYYAFIQARKDVKIPKQKIFRMAPNILVITAIIVLPIMGFNPLDDDDIKSINHIELFSYHTKDVVQFVEGNIKRSSVDKQEIIDTLNANVPKAETKNYNGIGKGKNLIVIQMESFQNFPIGKMYNGQVLTPNINKLLKKDTLYFPNYYQTLGKGNTADAEFASLNSFYPVIERESYRLYVENDYNGLPWLMRKEGYKAQAFHGYTKTFWNREEAYKKQGFQKFYSEEELVMTEKSGFGLTDKEMFKQAIAILKEEKEPTFSFMVTLTNHIPFELEDSLTNIKLLAKDDGTLFGHYMQSVRYADEAIGLLIELLKDNGMYENTVIAMYGDHHGMLNEYEDVKASMDDYLGYEYDYDEMLNVPLIIHLPETGITKTIDTVGGQIDLLPTLANIMDIDIPQPYIFGKDMANSTDGFAASVTYLLEGSFIKNNTMYQIGRDGTFKNGRAWSLIDRSPVSLDGLEDDSKRAAALVQLSKKVLDYNLMADYVSH